MLFKENTGKYRVFRISEMIITYSTQGDFSHTHLSGLKDQQRQIWATELSSTGENSKNFKSRLPLLRCSGSDRSFQIIIKKKKKKGVLTGHILLNLHVETSART